MIRAGDNIMCVHNVGLMRLLTLNKVYSAIYTNNDRVYIETNNGDKHWIPNARFISIKYHRNTIIDEILN